MPDEGVGFWVYVFLPVLFISRDMSSNVLLGRGSEKAFNERIWGKQCLPLCRLSLDLVTNHHEVASVPLGEVSRESCSVSA